MTGQREEDATKTGMHIVEDQQTNQSDVPDWETRHGVAVVVVVVAVDAMA